MNSRIKTIALALIPLLLPNLLISCSKSGSTSSPASVTKKQVGDGYFSLTFKGKTLIVYDTLSIVETDTFHLFSCSTITDYHYTASHLATNLHLESNHSQNPISFNISFTKLGSSLGVYSNASLPILYDSLGVWGFFEGQIEDATDYGKDYNCGELVPSEITVTEDNQLFTSGRLDLLMFSDISSDSVRGIGSFKIYKN